MNIPSVVPPYTAERIFFYSTPIRLSLTCINFQEPASRDDSLTWRWPLECGQRDRKGLEVLPLKQAHCVSKPHAGHLALRSALRELNLS